MDVAKFDNDHLSITDVVVGLFDGSDNVVLVRDKEMPTIIDETGKINDNEVVVHIFEQFSGVPSN